MRLAYGALVLSSLFLREDLSGDWERRPTPPWHSPPDKWVQLQNTFGYPQAFCWASSQSQWALRLAGAAALLLWVWAQAWTKGAPPEPKPKTQRELDFQIPQKRGSLCICGEPLIPKFERFEPLRRRRHSSSVICRISGARRQNVNKSDDYRRKYPPVIPRILSSSSSSSSFSSSTQLKRLAVQSSRGRFPTVTTEDSSWMVSDSLEEPENKTFDPSYEADDHRSHKIEQKDSLVDHRYPDVKKPVPQIQEITEDSPVYHRHPDVKKYVPQIQEITEHAKIRERPEKHLPEKRVPSFAQINFVESSAFKKDDEVFLVEKSLQIRMLPQDVGKPPILIEEEGGDKPKVLALLGRIVNVERDLKVEKPPIPKASPPICFGWNVARTTLAPSGFDPNALIVDKMGEGILGFLEYHVKKKMVQRQCGAPTVVVRSLQHFQSLGDFSPMERSVKGLAPVCSRSPASLVLAHRNVKAIYAKPRQKPLKERERYVFRRTTEAGRVTSSMKKPSVVMASSQSPREKYVLLSMQPNELKRIVSHVTVKMLEIKRGAFPEIVEGSFRTFSRFACRPLPKTIRLGNKVPRVKQAALFFVPEEVLCLLDLNIKHKYLVYAWRLPTPFNEASGASEGQKTPALVNKGMVQAQLSGQILVAPGPQMPLGLPPSSSLVLAEETPEGPSQLLAEEMKQGRLEMMQEGHLEKVHKEHKEKTQEGHPEKMKEECLEGMQEGRPEKMKEECLEGMQEGPPEKIEEEHPEKSQEAGGQKPKEGLLPSSVERPKPPAEVTGHEEKSKMEPEGQLTCAVVPSVVAGEALPGVDDGKTIGTEEATMSLKETEPERSSEVPPPPPFGQRGQDGEGSGTKGDEEPLKQPERPPSRKAVFMPGKEEAAKRPKETSIVRASLLLQLDLAKETLNLHLQKKLDATLRPTQEARLELDVGLDGRAKGHRRRHPHRSDRPASRSGSRPRRPFCYVCMPLDESGSAVKTVCWSLPSWILEMNGHRVPRVARFERKAARCK